MSQRDQNSPLHDLHAAMGATFVNFWGWVRTESFGDLDAEYRGRRRGAGRRGRGHHQVGVVGSRRCRRYRAAAHQQHRRVPT